MKKTLIVFCIAVGLSLTLAATSFAEPTLELNADSLTPGLYDASHLGPLTFSTAFGPVTFEGEIKSGWGGDMEFYDAGASENVFDITYEFPWAELSWSDFEVGSATFIYGGNLGNITIEARDYDGNVLDSFYQADTGVGQPAGPVTLNAGVGKSIRSLYWKDTSYTNDFAALDNINLTIIPAPFTLSGWVFMMQDVPGLGFSMDESDLVYFYSFDFVQSYNIDTGGWSIHMPTDLAYFDWPFYYELVPDALWFALPPEIGLWVYHFSTDQWEVLPQIIP